jgi:hypothetical protein
MLAQFQVCPEPPLATVHLRSELLAKTGAEQEKTHVL